MIPLLGACCRRCQPVLLRREPSMLPSPSRAKKSLLDRRCLPLREASCAGRCCCCSIAAARIRRGAETKYSRRRLRECAAGVRGGGNDSVQAKSHFCAKNDRSLLMRSRIKTRQSSSLSLRTMASNFRAKMRTRCKIRDTVLIAFILRFS